MKKLAIASRTLQGHGGATTTILEHTRRFTDHGWEVHLYGEKLDRERIIDAGGKPHLIPRVPLGSTLKRQLFAWLFSKKINPQDFSLIHGNGDIFKQDVLHLHNCVHLAHERLTGSPPRDSGVAHIHKKILSECGFKIMIANSKLMKNDAVKRFGVPEEKIKVIYPGTDPQKFNLESKDQNRKNLRARLGVKNGTVVIGMITSGDLRKRGIDILIEAVAKLPAPSKEKVLCVVVGKESNLSPTQSKIQKAGLGSHFKFLPPIAEVQTYFHGLDIFAYPAVIEEFGQSVQEAMVCGVPVLTSQRVGATELLKGEARSILKQ